jgi:aspartate kinase
MQVYKFGGASVKDAEGVRNLCRIISLNPNEKLLIVVSAMGKTTNALEALNDAYLKGEDTHHLFEKVRRYHYDILLDLFEDADHIVFDEVENTFIEIEWMLEEEPHPDRNFNYDQIVSIGELLSSRIVSAFLNTQGFESQLLDARGLILTDNSYREGIVDWEKTSININNLLPQILEERLVVTQGFIGGTSENYTTTLGREGSDYSAAIFAACLKAESVTIWKDVPGVLNADPKLFSDTHKYTELPYSEALEMTYYGATIIHPKTIKPLKNLDIPLLVKPFLAPAENGTVINRTAQVCSDFPSIIVKNNQVLSSFSSKDFSFITEDHLSEIFKAFADVNLKVNMMQTSALSFSVCFDGDQDKFKLLKQILETGYKIKYNQDLQLVTIRHYNIDCINNLSLGKSVLLEQLSRNTAQLVLK